MRNPIFNTPGVKNRTRGDFLKIGWPAGDAEDRGQAAASAGGLLNTSLDHASKVTLAQIGLLFRAAGQSS